MAHGDRQCPVPDRCAGAEAPGLCRQGAGPAEAGRAGGLCEILAAPAVRRSEEHTSELQSLMRISYAVFCLKKKRKKPTKQLMNNKRREEEYKQHSVIERLT